MARRRKQTIIKIEMLCFICEKSGNVIKFTDERLEKCQKILAFRKKKVFKYNDIELPCKLFDKGYHTDCYNRFVVIRSSNREEFESMFKKKGGDLKKNEGLAESCKKELADTSTITKAEDPTKIEMPRPIGIPHFKTEINEIETYDINIDDIKQEKDIGTDASDPKMVPFVFTMDTGTSYIDPDISKAVILKSILTRKSPIKKDMSKDTLEFNSGFDFLRPYVAVSQVGAVQINLNPPTNKTELKIVNTTTLADTGICIFCNNKERRIGTQRDFAITLKGKMYEKVLSCAKGLQDFNMAKKLETAKEVPCHPLCRTEYRHKYEKLSRKNCDEQDWLVFKNLYAEAFDGLCAFIDDKIIDKHETYFLSDIYEKYKALLYEIQNSATPFDFVSYSSHNLQEKILKKYYGTIQVSTSKIHKKKILHKSNVKTNLKNTIIVNEHLKYDKLAYELRNDIKSRKRVNFDSDIDEIPKKLFRFIESLLQGPDVRGVKSYYDGVRVKSMCKDIVSQIIKD